MEITRCPKCGKEMIQDKIMSKGVVYADRLRCFKCGYWETRALQFPRPKKIGDFGIEIDLD